MRVLITGVNGFIGNSLASFLKEKGHEVYGTSSKEIKNKYCVDTYQVTAKEIPSDTGVVFDWIIHMTYSKMNSVDENITSTILIGEKFNKNGVKNQIFFSSISAISSNNSSYGIIKKRTEDWFITNNMHVVRPGLVVGDGGLFKNILNKVKLFPILPLIDGGRQKVKLIGLRDLLEYIETILNSTNGERKEHNLFYTPEVTLSEVLWELAKFYNRKILFISIPFFLVYILVWVSEKFHLNIGISTVNLIGLRQNQDSMNSNFICVDTLQEIFQKNLIPKEKIKI